MAGHLVTSFLLSFLAWAPLLRQACAEQRESQGAAAAASLRMGKALSDGASATHQHHSRHRITRQPEIEQHLVICNAYASPLALDIYHVQSLERLTNSEPLSYKECREFTMNLNEGDQLDFKAGTMDVGTFYATGLPKSSASLLLIPHRRDPHSASISFESHAFADLQSPQIAVVDTYHSGSDEEGEESGPGFIKIVDAGPETETAVKEEEKAEPVEEELQFSSVVAVNPGKYKVSLNGSDSLAAVPLLCQTQAKYVVMRVGSESNSTLGESYPQELIVFPQSGAFGLSASLPAAAAAICIAVVAMVFS